MPTLTEPKRVVASLADVELELDVAGSGRTMLVLPGLFALERDQRFIESLADEFTVVVATPPGFSERRRPNWCDSIQDLAYLYLDLAAREGYDDAVLVGCSLGGWVAAEIAIRQPAWLSHLVLVDSFGIRVGERDERDVTDIFAIPFDELRARLVRDPEVAKRYLGVEDFSAEEVEALARAQEAVAVYGWEPYLHDPKLRRRLARIATPTTVVWGEEDGIISPAHGAALADAIPGGVLHTIPRAAHMPHLERPGAFREVLSAAVTGKKGQ